MTFKFKPRCFSVGAGDGQNYDDYEDNLKDFSKNFIPNGAENSAKIASEILEEKR